MNDQVDLVALTRTEREVARDLILLAGEYGEMPPDADYWRRVVLNASRLFGLGGIDEGMRVLAIVPVTYFRTKLLEHMATDDEFYEAARVCAHTLLNAGRATPPKFSVDTNKVLVHDPGVA